MSRALKSDTSRPLRDIPPLRGGVYWEDHDNPAIPHPGMQTNVVDSIVQRALGPLAMPAPIQNFEGQYNQNGRLPPDTNGDVGRNYYVQIVNSTFQVWNKTGTSLYGPANNNTLFTGFGGTCETRNDGDPVVLYDALADRWVMTWFTSAAPYMECIAVSTSPDPTGAWYRYAFLDHNSGTTLGDYPKMAVWPDAYYMTTNEFSPGFTGGGNYAFERDQDAAAATHGAKWSTSTAPTAASCPATWTARTLPPAGSPNYFLTLFNQPDAERIQIPCRLRHAGQLDLHRPLPHRRHRLQLRRAQRARAGHDHVAGYPRRSAYVPPGLSQYGRL